LNIIKNIKSERKIKLVLRRKSNKNLIPNKTSLEIAARHISQFDAINQDQYLKPYEGKIKEKLEKMNLLIREIENNEKSLIEFSQSYKIMGLTINGNEMLFREYAPGAKSMSLVNLIFINNKK